MKVKNNIHSNPALIFSCSGASDVGELADRSARRLSRSGLGKMFCIAAIGGHVKQYIDETQKSKDIIIIDGCSNDCAKRILHTINVSGHEFNLEQMDFTKGESPATGTNINKVLTQIQAKLC